MKKITSLLLITMISFMGVFAQTEQNDEVSDQEVKQFASAYIQIQTINQQAQQDMAKAVEEAGLEVKRFIEIQKSEQDTNQKIDAEGEELQKYQLAKVEIEKIQAQSQQQMQEKIVESGLTINRYQQIASKLQGDPELQKKIQEHLQG
jgi:hypothetical protein